jgi:hypothetical protein
LFLYKKIIVKIKFDKFYVKYLLEFTSKMSTERELDKSIFWTKKMYFMRGPNPKNVLTITVNEPFYGGGMISSESFISILFPSEWIDYPNKDYPDEGKDYPGEYPDEPSYRLFNIDNISIPYTKKKEPIKKQVQTTVTTFIEVKKELIKKLK